MKKTQLNQINQKNKKNLQKKNLPKKIMGI